MLRPPSLPGPPCERGANTSATTRVHARVTPRRQIPSTCGVFVPAKTRACPPFPPRNLNGKEGVDGSSPSEGSAKAPEIGAFSFRPTCTESNVRWVWSPLWSLQIEKYLRNGRKTAMLPSRHTPRRNGVAHFLPFRLPPTPIRPPTCVRCEVAVLSGHLSNPPEPLVRLLGFTDPRNVRGSRRSQAGA